MKRRSFLQSGSILTLPMLLQGMQVSAITNSSLFNAIDGDTDRVLVLIQLNGGNDGLNTMIPLDQYTNLMKVRENIIIPENQLVSVSDTNAFHPSFAKMKDLYDTSKLAILQSVGYPNQNRSHFRSTDIWTTASASDEFLTTGWLGRYLDIQYPGYPDGFPNEDCPDPFAMTLGYIVSETCQGTSSNFSFALNDPENLVQLTESEGSEVDNTCYGYELSFVRESIAKANAYSATVAEAYDKGNNISDYGESSIGNQLRIVSRLISGGLRTKIYVVSIGGFDTHAAQVSPTSTLEGDHAELLSQLSEAIYAFQEDLRMMGLEERVIGMTFSEFGRRIRSNFSLGTDHGTAAPLFVFGSCVDSKILGDNPEINQDVDVQEGVPMQYDFRSVYGTILMDWFDVSESEVKNILFEDFQRIPFILECSDVTNTEEIEAYDFGLSLYPNPASDYCNIRFQSLGQKVRISIFDVLGHEVKIVCDKQLGQGDHKANISLASLPQGNYFLRIQEASNQKTKSFVKM